MKKMLKTFLRVSQGVSKVNHTPHVPRVQGTAEGWVVPEGFQRSGEHSQEQPHGFENLSWFCPTNATLPSAQRHVGVCDKTQCPPAFLQGTQGCSQLCFIYGNSSKRSFGILFHQKLHNLQSIKLMKSQEKGFSV